MSVNSSSEPKTNGKIRVSTTCGDFDIELWSRETPKTCRNFVQLCLEDYYDNTLFHRVLKNNLIQGGDPTGTGFGGESIYGKPFKDELHSRLKFTRRGLVAMANSGEPDSNASQFFITLSDCMWLNNQHTIFGMVSGKGIYNVLELSKGEIGENDRPLYPHKILSTKVLVNPYNDIVPRPKVVSKDVTDENIQNSTKPKQKSKNRSAIKNENFLSFSGVDDENSDEEIAFQKPKKFVSVHEAIKKQKDESKFELPQEYINKNESSENLTNNSDNENQGKESEQSISIDPIKRNREKQYKKLKNELIRRRKKAEMHKMGMIEETKKPKKTKKQTLVEKRSAKYIRRGKVNKKERQRETMRKLKSFSKQMHYQMEKFSNTSKDRENQYKRNDDPDEESSDVDEYWFRDGTLKFSRVTTHLHDFSLDDYIVKDPKKDD